MGVLGNFCTSKWGHKLIAVFPRKEAKTFNDLATFSMPETFTQTGKTAELAATTYMVATGDVTDNKIPALTFSPLTALIQFGLKNTSDREPYKPNGKYIKD